MGVFCFWVMSWAGLAEPPPVILISIDGFRWDYADHIATPNIDRIVAEGFRVESMKPSFPSLTFPNHYTLVTGRHPHHHGIVGNQFFDAQQDDLYSMYRSEDVTDPKWYMAPAIWEVAEGAGMESASYFWVGSEMKGRHPVTFLPFKNGIPPKQKVETVLQWIDPKQRPSPRLVLAYFSFVDSAGHLFGPDSPEVVFAVQRMDAVLGMLLDGFDALQVEPNVIVVSDHGMTNLNGVALKVEDAVDAIGADSVAKYINNYSQLDLFLKDPTESNMTAALQKLPKREGYTWYRRARAPFPMHPSRNGDIVGIADLGYVFQKGDRRSKYAGGHGYDPNAPDMGSICFGFGPAFESMSELNRVQAVDIFPLVAHLLGIDPPKNDGALEVWGNVLAGDMRP